MLNPDYLYKAVVVYVVDGDTVDAEVDLGFKIKTVQRFRIYGINTPERGQEGYKEAKERMKELTLGQEVIIQSEKTGSFGRWLAKIWTHDAIYVPDIMLNENLAVEYRKK